MRSSNPSRRLHSAYVHAAGKRGIKGEEAVLERHRIVVERPNLDVRSAAGAGAGDDDVWIQEEQRMLCQRDAAKEIGIVGEESPELLTGQTVNAHVGAAGARRRRGDVHTA